MSYGGGSSGSSRISTAADAALSNPQNGDVLTYNSGVQKWSNTAMPTGSGGSDSVSLSGFSAAADGLYGGGSISSGSSTLTFNGGGLTPGHVGAIVRIAGAGASGSLLVTTIAGYASSTSATLASNASTTVSSAHTLIGHNNTSAISDALAAANGRRLTFPKGTYYIGTNITIPAGTVVDLTGATLLYGGFSPSSRSQILNGTFIGDNSGVYGAAIFVSTSGSTDVVIKGNTFRYHNWGILQNVQPGNGANVRWNIRHNAFDYMRLGCTYIGFLLDSHFENNISTNITPGCNTFNFQGTQQRNKIRYNTVNGGRAGIIFLWDAGYNPTPSATQGNECWGNVIHGNTVLGQTEEGISMDGGNRMDNATIASVAAGSNQITLSGSAWAGAGNVFRYYWLYAVNGANAGKLFRITAMNNAILTLASSSSEASAFAASDLVLIGSPFRDNVISANYVDGRNSETFSIWLYSFCIGNTVANNTALGAPIGTGSTNSMAPVTGSVTGASTTSPSSNNTFIGNTCREPLAQGVSPNYYGHGPGIWFLYFNYGNQAAFYSYGNTAIGNHVLTGTISGGYNQKLTANNMVSDGIAFTNQPSGGLTFG